MSKVYNDINKSEYIYIFKDLIFYFSSEFYMNKFIRELDKYINDEELKLKIRYNVNFEIPSILALSLYKKIEKRGFKVLYNDSILYANDLFMNF